MAYAKQWGQLRLNKKTNNWTKKATKKDFLPGTKIVCFICVQFWANQPTALLQPKRLHVPQEQ